jgi:beta-phosphoglucomutase-like phosphatase (HAD superfamily)
MLGIIFDCDGTLIDTEYAQFLSWVESAKKRGYHLTKESYAHLAGQSAEVISENLYDKIKKDSPKAIWDDKIVFYKELQRKGIPPIERTVKFAKELALRKDELQLKLAVASAAKKEEILLNLRSIGLLDLFEVVVSGKEDVFHYLDPEGVNKPKPYVYLHTAELLGLDPLQCVAFEDSGPGVLAATSAGLFTFAVPNLLTLGHDLSKAHHRIEPHEGIDMQDFFHKIQSRRKVLFE